MLRKIKKAIATPEMIIPHLLAKKEAIIHIASEKRFGEALAYAPTTIGIDTYTPYMRLKSSEGLIKREIQGFEMYLDPLDKGISQDLLVWGIREELPVKSFKTELKILSEEVNGKVTVIDIGTNIGYFLLIEATTLGDTADIYTIEPDEENRCIALKNIEMNDFEIEVQQGAIGPKSETVELYVSVNTNTHRVNNPPIEVNYEEILEVPQWTLDEFIDTNGIKSADVNVLRMDIEGYETEVFKRMGTVLDNAGPLVIFFELHSKTLSNHQLEQVISRLKEHEFQIVSAFHDPPLLPGKKLDDLDYEDIYTLSHDIQLIVKKY